MAITWTISQLPRDLSDGLVTNAYWICNVTDGDLSASNSGSVGFERGNTFTPYENLTQEQVLAWVQSQLNVSEIEAGLQSHIDALKTPVTATGVPWATA
jgi:hypothetical protein